MTKTTIFVLAILFNFMAKSQTIEWNKTDNWKIYALQSKNAVSIDEDSLKKYPYIKIEKQEILSIFNSSKQLKLNEPPAWNGFYLMTYEDSSNHVRKVFISPNGSAILLKSNGIYYEIAEDYRESLRDLITDKIKKIKYG